MQRSATITIFGFNISMTFLYQILNHFHLELLAANVQGGESLIGGCGHIGASIFD
jgi:ABC-type xylose transport system permease subunit